MKKSSKHSETSSRTRGHSRDLCNGSKGLIGAKQFEKVKGTSGKENSTIKGTELTNNISCYLLSLLSGTKLPAWGNFITCPRLSNVSELGLEPRSIGF